MSNDTKTDIPIDEGLKDFILICLGNELHLYSALARYAKQKGVPAEQVVEAFDAANPGWFEDVLREHFNRVDTEWRPIAVAWILRITEIGKRLDLQDAANDTEVVH